ncbi:MAG: glycosyltransferase [Candidatus Methanodesulfokora sp.]
MRFYISFVGIGYGHASRCINIARKLIKMGHEVFLSSYGDGLGYVARESPDIPLVIGGEKVAWKMREDGSPDIKGTLARLPLYALRFFGHVKGELENIEAVSPDVVISDSRISTIIAARSLGFPLSVIVNQPRILLDSPLLQKGTTKLMGTAWNLSNSIIMADLPPPYTISRAHVEDLPKSLYDRLEFVGPIVRRVKKANEEERRVLVLISGPLHERIPLINSLLPMIRENDEEDIQFIVSLGDAGSSYVERGRNYVIHGWLQDKWEVLRRSDLVVCRGGHTTISEAILSGIPVISIPVPGHSEKWENSRSIERIGAGLVLEQDRINLFFNYVKTILENQEYYKKANEIARRFSRWNSVDRAIGIILSSIH